MAERQWNDERMRNIMGNLLRIGVISSAVIVLVGGILYFFQHPYDHFDFRNFQGEPRRLRHVNTIIHEFIGFKSRAVIQAGILLLILTPIARVVFSFIGFIFERDWIYTAITLLVIIILTFSLLSGYS